MMDPTLNEKAAWVGSSSQCWLAPYGTIQSVRCGESVRSVSLQEANSGEDGKGDDSDMEGGELVRGERHHEETRGEKSG